MRKFFLLIPMTAGRCINDSAFMSPLSNTTRVIEVVPVYTYFFQVEKS
jgi:hypothetical protein